MLQGNRSSTLHTDRIFDSKTIQLSLGKSTPNFRLVDLDCVVQTTVDANNVLNKDVDCLRMFVIFLVDRKRLLVQLVVGCNLGHFICIVILKLVNIVDDLALVRTDCGEHEKVLKGLVVTEGGGLENDLFQQLDELDGEIGREESFDGHRNIVRVGAFRKSGGNDLTSSSVNYGKV